MFPHTKPPAGTQINPLHPLSKGLVGCWLFNEGAGSLANDISGNKNHGRLTNMAPNVQGSGWGGSKFGGGLEFDGVDDYVDCGNSSSFDITEAITINVWVNINSTGTIQYLVAKDYSETVYPYTLYLDSSNRPIFTTNVIGGDANSLNSNAILPINTWYLLSAVYDGSTKYIYIDGILKNSAAWAGPIGVSTDNLSFGWQKQNNTYQFSGHMGSASVYNRALSADEVAWSYREPYAMFEPAFNPALLYSAAPPVGAIMNQFQKANIGADLYNGVFA